MVIFGQRFARRLAFGTFQRYRNEFFLNPPGFIRIIRTLLRAHGKAILHFARDALLRCIQIRSACH